MPLQFKDWRYATKNRLIGNLPLQFNHTPKLAIAIQSDIGNLPFNLGVWLNFNGIYPISQIVIAYLKTAKVVMAYFQLTQINTTRYTDEHSCISAFDRTEL
jgi:hypothetical protein